ncbi:cell division FtsZ family protein [Patescibacteria group bacterium]|nr:cell division FtsZ family protein [Patescibacteria group bacterium]
MVKKKIKNMAKKIKVKKSATKKKVAKKVVVEKKVKVEKENIFAGVHKTKVRVIGIGGGGGTIVSEIISRIKKADFVVANTDSKALNLIKKAKRFQFGINTTKGLGTGMNVEVGEMAALEEKEKIEKLFEEQDVCIIVSSLGGGSGSGATPIFAKLSKNSNCLTYGIFTMPFEFEGSKKMEIAKEALNKIRPHLNAFSIIPNERIFKIIDKNTPLKDALSAINERLAKNLSGLIEMIYLPGLINIDFADLRTILSGRGKLSYLNTVEINTSNKEDAIKKVVSSPLYPYTINGCKDIVYNMMGSKNLQLSEVSRISKIIADSVSKNAKIIFGINQGLKSPDKLKITLLATGCSTKGVIENKKKVVRTIKKIIKPQPKPEPEPVKIEKPKPKPKKVEKPVVQAQVVQVEVNNEIGIRRNALQVRKAVEEEENELIEKENIWEIPAILRKKDE